MKRIKNNQYFHLGAMLLGVITISIALLAVVLNLEAVGRILHKIGDVLSPLVIGAVLAYLMNPLMNFLDRRLKPFLIKRKMKAERAHKLSRVVSLLFALLVFAILVYEFCALLLPQLYESIRGIVPHQALHGRADRSKRGLYFHYGGEVPPDQADAAGGTQPDHVSGARLLRSLDP